MGCSETAAATQLKAHQAKLALAHAPRHIIFVSPLLIALVLASLLTNAGYGIVLPVLPSLVVASASAVGAVYSFFSVSKTAAQLCGGVWSDSRSASQVLVVSLLLYAVSLCGLAASHELSMLIIWRAVEGVAVGLSYPSGAALLLQHDAARFTRNNGAIITAGGVGLVAGPAAVAWAGAEAARGMMTGLAAATAVVTLWLVAISPRALAARPSASLAGTIRVLARYARSPYFWALLMPLAFGKMVFSVLQPLLPLHAARLHANEQWSGALFAATGIVFALCQPFSAWATQRFSHRTVVTFATSFAAFDLAAAGVWVDSRAMFSVAYLGYVAFGSMLFAALLGWVAVQAGAESSSQATLFGVTHALTDVSTFIAPPLLLGLYDHDTSAPFVILAALGLLAALAFRLGKMPATTTNADKS